MDLTSNTEGTCVDAAIAAADGTARTHTGITGTTLVPNVRSVTFDIGISQGLMRDIIEDNTQEGAPSPFNEMYWNWATGYRFFVMSFAVKNGQGVSGEGPGVGCHSGQDNADCPIIFESFGLDLNTGRDNPYSCLLPRLFFIQISDGTPVGRCQSGPVKDNVFGASFELDFAS